MKSDSNGCYMIPHQVSILNDVTMNHLTHFQQTAKLEGAKREKRHCYFPCTKPESQQFNILCINFLLRLHSMQKSNIMSCNPCD